MRVVFEPVGETAGLAKAIVDYVATHPAAEDALDGIAEAFLQSPGASACSGRSTMRARSRAR